MIRYTELLFILVILVNVSACSSPSSKAGLANNILESNAVSLNHQLFYNSEISVISEQELFRLSKEQEDEFIGYYQNKLALGKKGHVIISDYLSNYLSGFTYYGTNLPAMKSMELKQGNCMTLAVLSVALVKLTDVEFDFREVTTMPIFEKKNSLLLSSSHVQTRLYEPDFTQDKSNLIFRPGIAIDYFPDKNNIKGKYFSYKQFLSLYYQNIAADAMISGDLDTAFANAYVAYSYDLQSIEALNLLAVIHRRKGDIATAEKIYVAAMQYESANLSLINNYAVLLEKEQRHSESVIIRDKLMTIDDPNPYSWLEQAYMYKKNGRYKKAIKTYNKVVELAPYVNSAYLGLYQSYVAIGSNEKAENALKKGLEWTYEKSERNNFKYKLYGLNALSTSF